MLEIVYFSQTSENTKRFVEKLGFEAIRIPIASNAIPPSLSTPFVLVTPTYCKPNNDSGIPWQVKEFMNVKNHRKNICAVIAAGNTNFGNRYCHAGITIARKCKVPLLYQFELLGTPHDVDIVKSRISHLKEITCQKS